MHLNVDPGYFRNLKTKRLTGLLGKGSEVLPLKLWAHCAEHHASNGELAGYSAQEVEECVGWWGKPGAAVDAMLKVKFLESAADGYRVHDWLDHQGHISAYKERARNAALIRHERVRKAASSSANNDSSNAPSNALASQANPALPAIPAPPASAGDGGGGGDEDLEGAGGALAAALRGVGVKSAAKIRECCGVPGLTPVGVIVEANDLRGRTGKEKVRDVAAVLVKRVLDEGYVAPTLLSPLDVWKLTKTVPIESIAGHPLGPSSIRYNEKTGVFFEGPDGETAHVPLDQLTPANIVLKRSINGQGH